MKKYLLIIILLMISSCDTAPKWPEPEKCMQHQWIKGIYKFKFIRGSDIYMEKLETGQKYKASIFENGWSEVPCPN